MPLKIPTKTLIIIAVLGAIFLPPFAKYQELAAKSRLLDRQLRYLSKEITRLEEEKRRLETDITYIEKKAREKIGLVKKGEIVIKEMPPRQ